MQQGKKYDICHIRAAVGRWPASTFAGPTADDASAQGASGVTPCRVRKYMAAASVRQRT